MSDDQNKPEQTPAQTSNNEPTPAPASKLIPTKRSTLLWMLGVLIIGILVDFVGMENWAFCHKCAAN